MKTTPFYDRLAGLNRSGLWTHWSGHLSATKYDLSAKHEYFAVRNGVGVFDTSPLFKYWIRGRDAERFLAGVLTRDIRRCRPGHAQYTVWCDDGGYVLEDGVFFRHSDNEFFLTSARPNLGYLSDLAIGYDVAIEDVSDEYGVLAVQGPRSRDVLATLTPDIGGLAYFQHTATKIGSAPVTVSRTGYTGDLGYEIFVPAGEALGVLDAVFDAGRAHGIRPFGEEALLMARIEAGLMLIDSEFSSSRLAYTDQERFTPSELGFGWMLRGLDADDRPFIGRDAIRRELAHNATRWRMVGVVLDWRDYDRLHVDVGLIPPKDPTPLPYESMVYAAPSGGGADGDRIGYATTLMYSPVLQRHIGLARVRPAYAPPDTEVAVEVTIDHEYRRARAHVVRLPHFNPERKTARP
jgi:aminomethyltransferase